MKIFKGKFLLYILSESVLVQSQTESVELLLSSLQHLLLIELHRLRIVDLDQLHCSHLLAFFFGVHFWFRTLKIREILNTRLNPRRIRDCVLMSLFLNNLGCFPLKMNLSALPSWSWSATLWAVFLSTQFSNKVRFFPSQLGRGSLYGFRTKTVAPPSPSRSNCSCWLAWNAHSYPLDWWKLYLTIVGRPRMVIWIVVSLGLLIPSLRYWNMSSSPIPLMVVVWHRAYWVQAGSVPAVGPCHHLRIVANI